MLPNGRCSRDAFERRHGCGYECTWSFGLLGSDFLLVAFRTDASLLPEVPNKEKNPLVEV